MDSKQSLTQLIEQWINPDIQAMNAYHVADASGMVKLDAMENPYQWEEPLKTEWLSTLKQAELNRYPEADASGLKNQLGQLMQVPEGMEILLGNGSDELILLLSLAVAAPGRTMLTLEPGFSMYRQIARTAQLDYSAVSLTENFELNVPATLEAIREQQPALIFIAQPNNPTGNLFDVDGLRQIIEAAPGLVIIDEAYTPFTDADFMPWLNEHRNLLIMRTLSKAGLAGLRLGLLVGSPAWLSQIDKIRLPYNIGVLTQATAEFALKHFDVLQHQTETIRTERARLYRELEKLEGLTLWSSEANFVLFRTEQGRARGLHQGLRDKGILIKCLDGAHPMLVDCLRVTVGTAEENNQFLKALSELL